MYSTPQTTDTPIPNNTPRPSRRLRRRAIRAKPGRQPEAGRTTTQPLGEYPVLVRPLAHVLRLGVTSQYRPRRL